MAEPENSRYRFVTRRAMLKASLGTGVLAVAGACGAEDTEVLAGQVAAPVATTSTSSTAAPANESSLPTTASTEAEATTADTEAAMSDAEAVATGALAVAGEMVIQFTYTQGVGGKSEPPYVAVWVENEGGELLETVALFYEQGRRGARWLDHLSRWFTGDEIRKAAGGEDVAATISSATRVAGDYAVAWDGTIDGVPAEAGTYSIYVESAREDGPVSLTGATVALNGSLPATTLADDGELSLVTVQTNG